VARRLFAVDGPSKRSLITIRARIRPSDKFNVAAAAAAAAAAASTPLLLFIPVNSAGGNVIAVNRLSAGPNSHSAALRQARYNYNYRS